MVDGLTWVDRLILRQIPADWDSHVTSGFIAERVPWLSSKEVAARIKKRLEHSYVEARMEPPKIYRLKPGLVIGTVLAGEAEP